MAKAGRISALAWLVREEGPGAVRGVLALAATGASVAAAVWAFGLLGGLSASVLGLDGSRGVAAGRGLSLLAVMFLLQWLTLHRLALMEGRLRGIARDRGLSDDVADDMVAAGSNGVFAGAAGVALFVAFAIAQPYLAVAFPA